MHTLGAPAGVERRVVRPLSGHCCLRLQRHKGGVSVLCLGMHGARKESSELVTGEQRSKEREEIL